MATSRLDIAAALGNVIAIAIAMVKNIAKIVRDLAKSETRTGRTRIVIVVESHEHQIGTVVESHAHRIGSAVQNHAHRIGSVVQSHAHQIVRETKRIRIRNIVIRSDPRMLSDRGNAMASVTVIVIAKDVVIDRRTEVSVPYGGRKNFVDAAGAKTGVSDAVRDHRGRRSGEDVHLQTVYAIGMTPHARSLV